MPQFRDNSYNFLLGLHEKSSGAEIRDQVLIDTSLATMQLMLIAKDKDTTHTPLAFLTVRP